jgi:hypothetical protein
VIEKTVTDYAERRGWEARKVMFIGVRGAPDKWFFRGGARLKIIEFKQHGEEPDPLQWKQIKMLRERGFEVHVIDNIASGCAVFD